MFLIDFRDTQEKILTEISNRNLASWQVPIFDFIKLWFDPAVTRFEVKTSGSTGKPKTIIHQRSAMVESALKTCNYFGLIEGNTVLLGLPLSGIGAKMMIVRSAVRKLRLICIEPTSNPLLAYKANEEFDFAPFTPMQMSAILSNENTKQKVNHINTIILGGGEVSEVLKAKLQEIPGAVYETYGMTETISHIALKRLNGSERSDNFETLFGVSISSDERSCMIIEAPYISHEKIITNDLVEVLNPKTFKWLGRIDNIINTGGIKVSVESIERKLHGQIPFPYFISATQHDSLGSQITLVVESEPLDASAIESLKKTIIMHLNKYEKPRSIITVNQFIYTPTGKLDKLKTIASR